LLENDETAEEKITPAPSSKGSIHRRTNAHLRQTKVILTAVIILFGAFTTLALNGVGSNAYESQTEGVVIDFGSYNTTWTDADYNQYSTASALLTYACTENSYTFTIADGILTEVNGISNNETTTWGLWTVAKGTTAFTKISDYSIKASDYTVTVWAYCAADGKPTVAVDASGICIYGYAQANRIVTLSPVATEIVGAMNGVTSMVGADSYSDYPTSVVEGKASGQIATVGTYTDPSYEAIMKVTPDLVICDGSQYSQQQMASSMRTSDINAVLLYSSEDINTILDNLFIVGVAMHYQLRAENVICDLKDAVTQIEAKISGTTASGTMITLSGDASPYVAGGNTYADDILISINGVNLFHTMNGWVHINSEYIAKYNPTVIIIYSTQYSATAEDYATLLANLSSEWKSTAAYQSGEIYLLADEAGTLAERSGPRFAQLMELTARILHPDAFDDGLVIPKYLGDDYVDYLTITKDLGYNT